MRIVKLFPNHGYYPDDEAFRPLWDVVAAKGMGVLSHCGWLHPEPGSSYASYYSHPGRFEKVIRLYPQIPFILAHMGGIAGYLETVMLTTRTPNTFVDCSPGQGLLVLEKGGPMVSAIPADRLLYGNDSYDMDAYLPRYRAALAAQGFGPQFPKVFHDNAKAVLEKIGAWPQ
jgi:predicted TIM-barrel fold metal-dependent hydrolase